MALVCQHCKKEFKHRPSLHRHLKTNACKLQEKKNEMFICAACNRAFDRKDSLREHINAHNNKKRACEFCAELFHRSSLNRHKKTCKSKVQSEWKI